MKRSMNAMGNGMAWKIGTMTAIVVALALAVLLAMERRAGAGADLEALQHLNERMAALEEQGQLPGRFAIDASGSALGQGMSTVAPSAQRADGDAAGLTAEQAVARDRQRQKALEADFSRQPPDPASAALEIDMLKELNSRMLQGADIPLKEPDIACKRHTCRITATFRSSLDATDWATLYVTTLGADYVRQASPAFTTNSDGSIRMDLYATRPAAK